METFRAWIHSEYPGTRADVAPIMVAHACLCTLMSFGPQPTTKRVLYVTIC